MNKRSVYAMRVLAMSAAVALASAAAYAQTTTPAANAAKPRMQLDANKDGVIDRAASVKYGDMFSENSTNNCPGLKAR